MLQCCGKQLSHGLRRGAHSSRLHFGLAHGGTHHRAEDAAAASLHDSHTQHGCGSGAQHLTALQFKNLAANHKTSLPLWGEHSTRLQRVPNGVGHNLSHGHPGAKGLQCSTQIGATAADLVRAHPTPIHEDCGIKPRRATHCGYCIGVVLQTQIAWAGALAKHCHGGSRSKNKDQGAQRHALSKGQMPCLSKPQPVPTPQPPMQFNTASAARS